MPRRIAAIAACTWTELVRLRIFLFLTAFALLLMAGSFFLARFSFEEEFQMLKDINLGAMSIFTSLLAILATAGLLPRDLEDRTIYTILAKPVSRPEYLAGKLLGVMALLLSAMLLMAAVFGMVLLLRGQAVLAAAAAETAALPAQDAAAAMARVEATVRDASLWPAMAIILLKSWLLAALTLLVSTFATSAIFTTMVAFAAYFIGHIQATARAYWLSGGADSLIERSLAALVALVFPDLQAFNVVDSIVAGGGLPGDLLLRMAMLAVAYIAVYYVLACALFHGREL